jgi:hypothetical protein
MSITATLHGRRAELGTERARPAGRNSVANPTPTAVLGTCLVSAVQMRISSAIAATAALAASVQCIRKRRHRYTQLRRMVPTAGPYTKPDA